MPKLSFDSATFSLSLTIPNPTLLRREWLTTKRQLMGVALALSGLSIFCFIHYWHNGLGLAYNDARSHLDIGRRVVEGLKPGLAQLGSVWLPLPHLLMVPLVWQDFLWHSGLAGAAQSMTAFVITGVLIYAFIGRLGGTAAARILGVTVFALNLNILYLQSTAMTELLLLATMTGASYYFLKWFQAKQTLDLVFSAGLVMLSTLVRYDGWFLLLLCLGILVVYAVKKWGRATAEGLAVLFGTLAGLGVGMWFIWNLLIFNDPLYFAFGEFSAHAQQDQLEQAGVLNTKHNWRLSAKIYSYALVYNSYLVVAVMGFIGMVVLWRDRSISPETKLASGALLAPLIFNILALYMGHSVLFIQGLSGQTWFNVRYGIMLMPSLAIFTGYLSGRWGPGRWLVRGLIAFTLLFAFANQDAVTIDDAKVGSSQKNVTEVSGWLKANALPQPGLVLISAASHDAIIFSSGLPMKRFIHEGTGKYWDLAVENPQDWARWIVMRTHDTNDLTFREVRDAAGLSRYELVQSFPFADIYQLKPEYVGYLLQ